MLFKRIAIILSAIMTFSVICPSAVGANDNLNVVFDVNDKVISITGSLADDEPSVTVAITSFNGGRADFSSDKLPDIIKIVPVNSDGSVDYDIPGGTYLSSGKYSAYFSRAGKETISKDFMIVNPDDNNTKNALNRLVNESDLSVFKNVISENSNALGIDKDNISESYFEYAGDSTYRFAYEISSVGEFYDVFSGFVAIAMICDGSSESAVMQYGAGLKTSYEKYNTLSEKCREELASLLKKYQSENDLPWILYNDAFITSQIKTAGNWNNMKELIVSYVDDTGIDMSSRSEYDKLSVDQKSEVFTEMYRVIKNCDKKSDIKKLFDQIVDSKLYSDNGGSSSAGGLGSGKGGGGFSAVSSNTDILKPLENNSVEFSDISSHFASDYIKRLAVMKVVSGFPDGTYRPDMPVSRAEFSKMVCVAFGINKSNDINFKDVNDSDWFAPYVEALASNNIVLGYDGDFRPHDFLTREDAAVIISRVVNLNGSADLSVFSDSELISDYAKDAVGRLTHAGILKGDGINFNPKNSITRGETATIVGRLVLE